MMNCQELTKACSTAALTKPKGAEKVKINFQCQETELLNKGSSLVLGIIIVVKNGLKTKLLYIHILPLHGLHTNLIHSTTNLLPKSMKNDYLLYLQFTRHDTHRNQLNLRHFNFNSHQRNTNMHGYISRMTKKSSDLYLYMVSK